MSDVKVVDHYNVVHLHSIHSSNLFKCRSSFYVQGAHKGPVRTKRELSCFWCIAGKRFK
jgi:hypothetical protein